MYPYRPYGLQAGANSSSPYPIQQNYIVNHTDHVQVCWLSNGRVSRCHSALMWSSKLASWKLLPVQYAKRQLACFSGFAFALCFFVDDRDERMEKVSAQEAVVLGNHSRG